MINLFCLTLHSPLRVFLYLYNTAPDNNSLPYKTDRANLDKKGCYYEAEFLFRWYIPTVETVEILQHRECVHLS